MVYISQLYHIYFYYVEFNLGKQYLTVTVLYFHVYVFYADCTHYLNLKLGCFSKLIAFIFFIPSASLYVLLFFILKFLCCLLRIPALLLESCFLYWILFVWKSARERIDLRKSVNLPRKEAKSVGLKLRQMSRISQLFLTLF